MGCLKCCSTVLVNVLGLTPASNLSKSSFSVLELYNGGNGYFELNQSHWHKIVVAFGSYKFLSSSWSLYWHARWVFRFLQAEQGRWRSHLGELVLGNGYLKYRYNMQGSLPWI